MTLPEPPWTQAPSEVLAWGASGAGGRGRGVPRVHYPVHVTGFEARLPVSEEARILAHLARLGIGRIQEGGAHVPAFVARLVHRAAPERFRGRVGGTRIDVRLHKRSRIEVRVGFTPPASFRRASRLLRNLGLDPSRGTWL